MVSYSPKWRAFNTTVRVGTTRAGGLEPAIDAVRAVLHQAGSSKLAVTADLGARAAMRAARSGGVIVWVGADVATAGEAPTGGWQLSLANSEGASETDADETVVAIRSGAVATTSTREPAQWRSVTVAARSCAVAETAATAAMAKQEGAIQWLERRRLAARLVESDGTIHFIGRWPDPGRHAA